MKKRFIFTALVAILAFAMIGCPTDGGGDGGGNPTLYTVTFLGNGSTGGTAPSPITQATEGAAITLPGAGSLVKTGSTFGGWSTTASGTAISGTTYTPTGDVNLYAVWTVSTTPSVDSIVVTGPAAVAPGGTGTFHATVTVSNGAAQTVAWSITETNKDAGTTIVDASDNTGVKATLTVAGTETLTQLTIRATSTVSGFTNVFGEEHVAISADAATVTSITISPKTTADGTKGGTVQFTATVVGTGTGYDDVTWEVDSSTSTISTTGLLSIGANETAALLTVTVTSVADTSQSDTATVTIAGNTIEDVAVSSTEDTVEKGSTLNFVAVVTPTTASQAVTWTVEGNAVPGTIITDNGNASATLTVDAAETATSLTVKATSVADPSKSGTKVVTVTAGSEPPDGELKITFIPWPDYDGPEIALRVDGGESFADKYGISTLDAGPDRPGYEFWDWYEADGTTKVTVDSTYIVDATVNGFYRSTALTFDADTDGYVEKIHLGNGAKAVYKFILPKGVNFSEYDKITYTFKASEASRQHNLAQVRVYGLWFGNETTGIDDLVTFDGKTVKVLNYNTYNVAGYIVKRDATPTFGNTQLKDDETVPADTWYTLTFEFADAGTDTGAVRPTMRDGGFFYAAIGLGGNGKVYDPDATFNMYGKDFGITQLIKDVTLVPKSDASAEAVPVIAFGSGDDFAHFSSYVNGNEQTNNEYTSTREVVNGAELIPVIAPCACTGCTLLGKSLEEATWGNIFCTCPDGTHTTTPCEVCERIGPPTCLCPNGTVHLEACTCAAVGFDCTCTIAVCECDDGAAGGTACALEGKEYGDVADGEYCTCEKYCEAACLVCRAVGPEPATADLDLLDSDTTVLGVKFDTPEGNWASFTDLNAAANALIPAGFDIRKYAKYSITAKFYKGGTEVVATKGAEILQVVVNVGSSPVINGYDLGWDCDDGTPPATGGQAHPNGTVNKIVPANVVGAMTFNFQSRGAGNTVADQLEITGIKFFAPED